MGRANLSKNECLKKSLASRLFILNHQNFYYLKILVEIMWVRLNWIRLGFFWVTHLKKKQYTQNNVVFLISKFDFITFYFLVCFEILSRILLLYIIYFTRHISLMSQINYLFFALNSTQFKIHKKPTLFRRV